MNQLDMYTREKVNQIHLNEMLKEADGHRRLRDSRQSEDPKNLIFNRKRTVALAFSAAIAVVASVIIAASMGLLPVL
jgi:hypothetical protein